MAGNNLANDSKQTDISFLTDISFKTDHSAGTIVSFDVHSPSSGTSSLSTDVSFLGAGEFSADDQLSQEVPEVLFEPSVFSTPHKSTHDWTTDSWRELSSGDNEHNSELPEHSPNSEDGLRLYLDISEENTDDSEDLQPTPGEKRTIAAHSGQRGRWKKRCMDRTSDSLVEILNSHCCQNDCIKSLSLNDLENSFNGVKDLNENELKQFALGQIWTCCEAAWDENSPKPNITYRFVICGKIICEKAFCRCYDISTKVFKDCVDSFVVGKRNILHGNRGTTRTREKTTTALTWMRYTFQQIGDHMPHKQEIHLPVSQTKTSLYGRMRSELIDQNVTDVVTKEYFMELWNRHFPEVKIGKRSEFTVCGICQSLKEKEEKATSQQERDECYQLKQEHFNHVQTEREQYHLARHRASTEPKEVTTMIVDGMDQSKTDLPHFAQSDKDTKHLAKITTHITGVLLHTRSPHNKYAYVYTDVKQIPHDSNLTIHCILATLMKHRDILGRELFLQLDNCFRENKNRYVLSFCALLVDLQIFQKVTVHFLPVGHTHEDVDQMFSCVAKALQKRNIYTYEDLRSFVKASYTPAIDVEEVRYLLDVKEWLKPHLAGNFAHHSKPLWFEFTPGDNHAAMRYKMWHNDPWKPEGDALFCLKSLPSLHHCPLWVEPCLERVDLPWLQKDIPSKYGDRIPPAKKEELRMFVDAIGNLDELPVPVSSWALLELVTWEIRHQEEEPTQDLEPLRARIQAECRPVTIGSQGRIQHDAVQEADYSSIEVGHHAAVNLIDSTKRPYLGKVLACDGDQVTIAWMKGSWSGEWKEWLCKRGKNMVPYTTTVPLQSVILWGFPLTGRNRLPKKVAVDLKERYSKIDEDDELNE